MKIFFSGINPIKFINIIYSRLQNGFVILICTLSCTLFNSCHNKHELYRKDLNDVFLSQENDSLLEGIYTVNADRKYHTIYNDFTGNMAVKYTQNPQVVKMKLQVRNEKKIDLTFLAENKVYKKRTLRGQFEEGYFKVNTKFVLFRPFFPILWGPARYYRRLGITENGKLVLIKEEMGRGMLFIVPMKSGIGLSQKEYVSIPE